MSTSFYITSGATVTDSNPFANLNNMVNLKWVDSNILTNSKVNIINGTITGFSPALSVVFANNSQLTLSKSQTATFLWDFGDYYNQATNNSTLSTGIHVYTMPGVYSVSLTTFIVTAPVVNNNQIFGSCSGKYDIAWYWDNLKLSAADVTWDSTKSTASKPKIWASDFNCYGKYCRDWAWANMAQIVNPVSTWRELASTGVDPKTWRAEPAVSCGDTQTTTTIDSIIQQGIVIVNEITPTAVLSAVSSVIGTSPISVRLSPAATISGSFIIDRIEWDFNDGSDIEVISRNTTVLPDGFFSNNSIPSDPQDPRNYDVNKTYIRTNSSTFYPSISVYSTNTNTIDTTQITVGPLSLPILANSDIDIIKIRNTKTGNLYIVDIDNNLAITTNSR